MTTIRVRFDGQVLVPEEPLNLPQGQIFSVQLDDTHDDAPENAAQTGLSALADWAAALPRDAKSPGDGAAQHDHYLLGTPKRPNP